MVSQDRTLILEEAEADGSQAGQAKASTIPMTRTETGLGAEIGTGL